MTPQLIETMTRLLQQPRLFSITRSQVLSFSLTTTFCLVSTKSFTLSSQASLDSLLPRLSTPHGRSDTRVTEIVRSRVGLLSSRKSLYGFRTFCTNEDLSTKKCVPCNAKDLHAMTEESANKLIEKVAEWNLVNENGVLKLNRSWKVKSFIKGLEFFQLVADVAEAEGHHPDLHLVGWNNVKIEIWTHAVGGLTENDFILAAKINGLDMHHLMRRKVSA